MSVEERSVPVREWICDPLPSDVGRVLDRLRRSEGIERIAVMPDVHLSGSFCIGTIVAARERLYPGAVGGDIGCGMAALRFEAHAGGVLDGRADAQRVLRALRTLVPTNRHSAETMPMSLPEGLEEAALSAGSLGRRRRRDGRVQFATLGRGNHFLELQSDDEGWLWLMVHSGSRAVGQAIALHHLRHCSKEPGGLEFLEADSTAGRAYLADVAWARAYAHASRLGMIDAVEAILGELFGVETDPESLITCDHNHVQREDHFGHALWVHRKGALSAKCREAGIIPGSMGTESYHTEGRGCADALLSSSHGAGRRMSRTEARQRIREKDFRRQMSGVWYDESLGERLRDEAPGAYKDVGSVMRAQRDLTRIVRRLRPLLVYKG